MLQVALDSAQLGLRQEVIKEAEECHENQGFLEDACFTLENQTMVEGFLTCRWFRDLFFGFFYLPSRHELPLADGIKEAEKCHENQDFLEDIFFTIGN